MKNTTLMFRSLAYLAAVVFGAGVVVVAAPVSQQVSRFMTISEGAGGALDAVRLPWRPTDGAVAPCGPLGFYIDGSAQQVAQMIGDAVSRLQSLSGLTFIEVTNPNDAYIVFDVVDRLESDEGHRALGVAENITAWEEGRAVIQRSLVSLSAEGFRSYTADFSAHGLGWTVLHEAVHSIGVGHLDVPGALMSPVRSHTGVLTDSDRAVIAAAGRACY